jgi:hypothetical protein
MLSRGWHDWGRTMTDPTVAHRDPEASYWAYEQWLAALNRKRSTTLPERAWKVTVSHGGVRTIYVRANP